MPSRSLSVLLVEDNPGDSELVSQRLADLPSAGFGVVCVTHLGDALDRLSAEAVDGVLLDLDLPDSKGLDTLRAVKAACGGAAILVMSSGLTEQAREEAVALGADDAFDKDESNNRLFARSVLYVIERRRATIQHRELEGVLSALPDAVLVVGYDGTVLYVNAAALELFHLAREDFIGELLSFSVGEDEFSEITVLRAGEPRACQMRLGRIEWYGKGAYLASLRDITEQKQMEMQLLVSDRMVAIGTLAAGVAHEINNPLSSVIGNLELALLDLSDFRGAPPDLHDELRDARDAAERVRKIVRDIKVFSRHEEETLGPVAVRQVVESALRMAWNEIRHRAQLVKDYGPPVAVHANEARLGQVLLNLLVNAAQSIAEGRIERNEIRVSTRAMPDGRVRISISDTGCGIPDATRARLFTPFFTTKPAGSGTGLGLAICQRIVSSFGGEIGFDSQVGRGSRFHVTLNASTGEVEDPEAFIPPPTPARRGRVLVVDDESIVLTVIQRVLRADHLVEATEDPHAALAAIEQDPHYDLVLCDLMMPRLSGIEFYQRVQARYPAQADRIVFLTGGAFTPAARQFLLSVPNAVIEKPVGIDKLRVIVANMIDQRAQAADTLR